MTVHGYRYSSSGETETKHTEGDNNVERNYFLHYSWNRTINIQWIPLEKG